MHQNKTESRVCHQSPMNVIVLLLHYIVAYDVSCACINPCSQHVTPLHCQWLLFINTFTIHTSSIQALRSDIHSYTLGTCSPLTTTCTSTQSVLCCETQNLSMLFFFIKYSLFCFVKYRHNSRRLYLWQYLDEKWTNRSVVFLILLFCGFWNGKVSFSYFFLNFLKNFIWIFHFNCICLCFQRMWYVIHRCGSFSKTLFFISCITHNCVFPLLDAVPH